MATYTQDDRPISVETPLGKDALLLNAFSGEERMSGLFSFTLDMLTVGAGAVHVTGTARDVAEKVVRPLSKKYDDLQEYPWEIRDALAEAGLFGVWIPKEFGGHGGGVLELCLVVEELSRACGGIGVLFAVNALGSFPILLAGTDEQKQRYLPDIAAGKRLIAFGLSERGAGSDASGLATTAVEKQDGSGNVSYDPANHAHMIWTRAEKVARVAADVPDLEVHGEPEGGELLVLGWGSTAGAITGAVNLARREGLRVSRAHLHHLSPFPSNLGDVLARFEKVLVPELNLGQLAFLLQGRFLKRVISYPKVEGKPFFRNEVLDRIREILGEAR